jgi:hypothetical protein
MTNNVFIVFESAKTIYLLGFIDALLIAFYNCEYLTDIYYEGSRNQWRNGVENTDILEIDQIIVVHCSDGDILLQ